jgi:hypothetical protein
MPGAADTFSLDSSARGALEFMYCPTARFEDKSLACVSPAVGRVACQARPGLSVRSRSNIH